MLEQREIVLVPVPFTDLTVVKSRPVLILSSSEYNTNHQDIIVAAITSRMGQNAFGRIISSKDLDTGTLPRPSMVRADKIYTLDQRIVVKRFGKLCRVAFQDVLVALDSALGKSVNSH
ncbi:MAG: type II toxin-antitoxin system PemK/MazF family toxin [Candidatus Hydrogenedentes bacterium]|nr:type II toxin-antitoxin system PemK/MazF family toxin [Candidatus Hydrogenedentota bacterium]